MCKSINVLFFFMFLTSNKIMKQFSWILNYADIILVHVFLAYIVITNC